MLRNLQREFVNLKHAHVPFAGSWDGGMVKALVLRQAMILPQVNEQLAVSKVLLISQGSPFQFPVILQPETNKDPAEKINAIGKAEFWLNS